MNKTIVYKGFTIEEIACYLNKYKLGKVSNMPCYFFKTIEDAKKQVDKWREQ